MIARCKTLCKAFHYGAVAEIRIICLWASQQAQAQAQKEASGQGVGRCRTQGVCCAAGGEATERQGESAKALIPSYTYTI